MPGHRNRKQTAEKAKDMKKALKKLTVYGNSYLSILIFTLILAAGGAILTVVGPNQISKITNYIADGLLSGINLEGIKKVGILLLCIYGASALFTFLQHFIMATLTQRISKQLRSDISAKINRVPLKYFSSNTYGDILSRVTNDVDTIAQALNNSIAPLIAAIAQVVSCVIMMFYNNWIMALSAIFSTIIGFALMLVIMGHSQRHFIARQNALGKLNGYVEEMYSGHDIVRVSGAETQIKDQFDVMNADVRDANWKSQFLSGVMQPLMNFIGNFGYVVVCVVGAILVMKDVAKIGTIAAFMLYIRLFTSPLSQIAQSMTNLQQAAASSERVFEF